jgi:hypothetical protein
MGGLSFKVSGWIWNPVPLTRAMLKTRTIFVLMRFAMRPMRMETLSWNAIYLRPRDPSLRTAAI